MTGVRADLPGVTARQREAWATGDFNRLAFLSMPASELLVAAADPRPGSRVLDVACGSGNAALLAARRFCEVTGLDFVPALIERARLRAEAEGCPAAFVVGDAQALPFPDDAFDTVLSAWGVQFAPDQERVAAELVRVCRPGGTIALANWGPGSYAAEMFAALARFVPPPALPHAPWRWGTAEGARELLGPVAEVRVAPRRIFQRVPSRAFLLDLFREYFGPVTTAFAAVGPERAPELEAVLMDNIARFDRAADGTCAVASDYLEVIARVR